MPLEVKTMNIIYKKLKNASESICDRRKKKQE